MEEMYESLSRAHSDQTQPNTNTNTANDNDNNNNNTDKNNNNNNNNNTTGSGSSSWGWGWGLGSIVDAVKQSAIVDVVKQSNIVDTVKQKSTSLISIYTEDLQEFKKTIQKDTTEAIKKIDNTQITEKITKGVTNLLNDLQISPNTTPTTSAGDVVPSTAGSRSQPVSRWEAQIISLEENPATFTTEIESGNVADSEYRKWKETFSLKNQNEDIINLLSSRSRLRDAHTRLVPTPLSHAVFWERYYYRLHKLKSEEERREKLLKSTMEGGIDEELTWDVDEESEASEGAHHESKHVIEKELIEGTEPTERKEKITPESPVSEKKEAEKELEKETTTTTTTTTTIGASIVTQTETETGTQESAEKKEERASEETKEDEKATTEESVAEPSTPKQTTNTSTSSSPTSPRDEDSWEMVDSPPSPSTITQQQQQQQTQTPEVSTNTNINSTLASKLKTGNDEEEWGNWE